MKITKEKLVYFLSLNLVSDFFLFILFFLFISNLSNFLEISIDEILGANQYEFFTIIFILPVFTSSLLVFVYLFFQNKKFNLLKLALFVSLFFPIFITILFFNDIKNFADFYLPFFILIPSFIFSLIILKITNPLRRKIVW